MKTEQKGHEELSEDSQVSKSKQVRNAGQATFWDPGLTLHQARIRDNQRRSRARRQEYLRDLERRLRECYVACREAELQRSAFQELQAENPRLRELLGLVGVSKALIQAFVRHDDAQVQSPTSALRQLKPKLAVPPTVPSQGASCRHSSRLDIPSASFTASTSYSSHSPTPSPYPAPDTNHNINTAYPSFESLSMASDSFSTMTLIDAQIFRPRFDGGMLPSSAYNDDTI